MVMATAAAEAEANVSPIDDEAVIGNAADLRWSRLSRPIAGVQAGCRHDDDPISLASRRARR